MKAEEKRRMVVIDFLARLRLKPYVYFGQIFQNESYLKIHSIVLTEH